MSAPFDRAALLAAMQLTQAARPRPVTVPGWPTCYVRVLSADDIDAALADRASDEAAGQPSKHRLAKAAARVLCDDTGALVFNPNSPEDLAFLGGQSWECLRVIVNAGDKHNELGEADAKNA
jgi:hypothetical protein